MYCSHSLRGCPGVFLRETPAIGGQPLVSLHEYGPPTCVCEEYHLLLDTRAGQTLCLSLVVFWQTVGVATVPPPRAVGEGGREEIEQCLPRSGTVFAQPNLSTSQY